MVDTDNQHVSPFTGFDRSVARMLGADMRLLYGMAVPILIVVGLIIVLGLFPATWLVVTALALEIAMLVVVVFGFAEMLGERDEDDPTLT